MQQPPALIILCILCILCIDVDLMVLLDGSAPSGGGGRARGQTGFSQRAPVGFQRSRPPDILPPHRRDDTPRERGRPARMLSLRLPLSFPAMWRPAVLPAGTAWARPKQNPGAAAGRTGWRRWQRLCQDLCGRDARAPGGPSSRDTVTPKEVHRSSCSFVVRLH